MISPPLFPSPFFSFYLSLSHLPFPFISPLKSQPVFGGGGGASGGSGSLGGSSCGLLTETGMFINIYRYI